MTDLSLGEMGAHTADPRGLSPPAGPEPGPEPVAAPCRSEPDDVEGDDLPVVILDHAVEVAALPDLTIESPALPTSSTPVLASATQDYLRAQGVTNPATWAAFRVGQVTAADLARFGLTGRRAPGAGGISLPTFDPRTPQVVAGVVRQHFAQNVHRFATAPAGLAGPLGVVNAPRVVLCDHPLLAMRLHEHGVAGVAIVEDPAVLVPLSEWLATRAVVTITTAKSGHLPLPPGVVPVGAGRICGRLAQASAATLALLGLNPVAHRSPLTRLPLSPLVVRDLHAYGERQLRTEAGMAALVRFDLAGPESLHAYRLGYLPADLRMALNEEQRRMLLGKELGGTIILPAYDAQGAVVDLLAMQACDRGSTLTSLWETPRGLCAPTVCTAFERLVITSVPGWVGRLFREVGPTLLLRGVANAQAEAARIAAGGVRQVELRCRTQADNDGIAEALRAVGIGVDVVVDEALRRPRAAIAALVTAAEGTAVEVRPAPAVPASQDLPPSPPETLVTSHGDVPLSTGAVVAAEPVAVSTPPIVAPSPPPSAPTLERLSHDAQAERAVFRFGAATYTVQVPWGTTTMVEVALTIGEHKHRDRFDLAVVAQRLRFASTAGLRTKLPPADIANALALILPALRELVVKPAEVAPVTVDSGMSAADRAAAMALLRDPALVDQITGTFDALGWIGEADAKLITLLAAISRLGDEPVWTVLTAESAGERFPALGILAAITPPDHLLHVSRLTDNALFHGDRDALRHKLLILDDLGSISRAAATALRVLHAHGVLSGTQVERDPRRGGLRTRVVQARGPLALVTASATGIPITLSQQVVEVAVDESPDQSARLLAARQRIPVDAVQAVARLINAQRLLRPLPVTMPGEVAVPVVISRHRALHAPFFGLVAASALLHQYQRPVLDGRLIATASDVALAQRAVLPLVGQVVSGLNLRARAALAALVGAGSTTFGMADLKRLVPDMTRSTLRRALDDLVVAECVVALRGRQGALGEYRVLGEAAQLVHLSTPVHAEWTSASREVVNG